MEEIKKWINDAINAGLVCKEGRDKLEYANTKEDLFRVLCDSFAADFIPEMMLKGVTPPIAEFYTEFKKYINGNRIMEYPKGYTSKMYVRTQGEMIMADTTIVILIECKSSIIVPKNAFPRIILSPNCEVTIAMREGSRLVLDAYQPTKYSISGDQSRCRINEHKWK